MKQTVYNDKDMKLLQIGDRMYIDDFSVLNNTDVIEMHVYDGEGNLIISQHRISPDSVQIDKITNPNEVVDEDTTESTR